jgi:hypothetical protein
MSLVTDILDRLTGLAVVKTQLDTTATGSPRNGRLASRSLKAADSAGISVSAQCRASRVCLRR